MKIFVVGGTGFLGRHFQEELKKYPDIDAVFAVRDRAGEDAIRNAGFRAVFADIKNKDELVVAAQGAEVLYNLVGIISGNKEDFYNLHVKGTENVVTAAKANGVKKIVYVSALGVENPKGSRIPYFATKVLAEKAVRDSRIPYVILRPAAMFGKGGGFLRPFLGIITKSPLVPLIGGGKYRIQILAVSVTASILVQSAPREITGTYVLSGPEILTLKEIVKRLLKYLHKKRVLVYAPSWLTMIFARIFHFFNIKNVIDPDQLKMLKLENFGDSSAAKKAFTYADIYFNENGSYPLI